MKKRMQQALVLGGAGIAAISSAIGYRVIDSLRYPYDPGTVVVALLLFGIGAIIGAYYFAQLPEPPPSTRPRDSDVGI